MEAPKDEAPEVQVKPPAVANSEKPQIKAGGKVEAIIPRDPDEAWRMSTAMVRAGMVPASYQGKTPEETTSKIMIGIMKGLEVGLPPQSALASIMIVNNRPSLWGDGALALVLNSARLEYYREWHEGDPGTDAWTAFCEMKRKDNPDPIIRTFSYGEAKAAKLLGKPGPWMTYPKRMLQMRARAFAIRDGFADVLQGLGIVEEQQDIPQKAGPVDAGFLDDVPQTALPAPDPVEIVSGTLAPEPVAVPMEEATTKPACERCGGKGTVKWEENGETGIEPCPECARKQGSR